MMWRTSEGRLLILGIVIFGLFFYIAADTPALLPLSGPLAGVAIGGAIAVAAMLANGWLLKQLFQQRDRDRAAQELERVRRGLRALRAEIDFHLDALRRQFDPRLNSVQIERMSALMAATPTAAPGTLVVENNFAFAAQRDLLGAVTPTTAQKIIAFYRADGELARLIETIAAGPLDDDPAKRRAITAKFFRMGERAALAGLEARAYVDASLAASRRVGTKHRDGDLGADLADEDLGAPEVVVASWLAPSEAAWRAALTHPARADAVDALVGRAATSTLGPRLAAS